MDLLLSANGDDAGLLAELGRSLPGIVATVRRPGLLSLVLPAEPPPLALARQWLPDALECTAPSVRGWALQVFETIVPRLPDQQPWRLHIVPHYGVNTAARVGQRARHTASLHGKGPVGVPAESFQPSPAAGQNRCELIRASLIELFKERRRHLLRQLRDGTEPFAPEESLVQVVLTAPEHGWISVAPAPLPFTQRQLLSPFPKGEVQSAIDKAAPSRAFAKLVEAEARLGRRIATGETCVDLGASPGSWTYVAANRGARVIAVDRSPLREDLMRDPRITFHRGDAFTFEPKQPVDWLLCDVIAAPERSVDLVLGWVRHRWARHFVVTIKLRGLADHPKLDRLKQELPALANEWFLTHLSANKGEACVFGTVNSA